MLPVSARITKLLINWAQNATKHLKTHPLASAKHLKFGGMGTPRGRSEIQMLNEDLRAFGASSSSSSNLSFAKKANPGKPTPSASTDVFSKETLLQHGTIQETACSNHHSHLTSLRASAAPAST